MTTQRLLSNFPEWHSAFRRHGIDMWRHRNAQGLWDLGTRRPNDLEFPLSESWRQRNARPIDWSVRCLLLLHKLERA